MEKSPVNDSLDKVDLNKINIDKVAINNVTIEKIVQFLDANAIEYEQNCPVETYLTIGIGGSVRLAVTVETESRLRDLFMFLYPDAASTDTQLPVLLLGGGSNVVFPDGNSELMVVINRTHHIRRLESRLIKVNSGVITADLMSWACVNGAGGMDFLAGIPGTVGGAAAVNAGAFGISVSSILRQAEIVTVDGRVETVGNDYFQFLYRDSKFKYGKEIILNVTLQVEDQDPQTVNKAVQDRLDYRGRKHPGKDNRSAGCFFKNPVIDGQKVSAGQLIENAGFKGIDCGTLKVSDDHANFVINRDHASFAQLRKLEEQIREKVLQQNGIRLEREVIYISPNGRKY